MRSYDLYEGQVVEVTIKGIRVTDTLGSGFRGVNDDGIVRSTRTYAATNELYFPERAVIIGGSGRSTRSAMTVKVGDIYRANGEIWYVREYQGKGGTVVVENGRGDSYSDDKMNIRDEMQDFENLKPVLLTRDGKAV